MTLNIRAHRSNLSRRLGPVFAEAALEAQEGIKTGQEAPQKAAPMATPQPVAAKAYKPAHGGYPGTPKLRNPPAVLLTMAPAFYLAPTGAYALCAGRLS